MYYIITNIQCAARDKPPPCRNLRLEIEESCLKNPSNSVENSTKIVENWGSRGTFELLGDPLGAKMAQDAIWSASGGPFGWLLGRILAPRWRQVGQLGAKMCPRWPTWGARLPTWRTFWSILATFVGSWARSCQKWRKPKKRRQFITLGGFLGSWGCSWRLCWLILALRWAILGHLGAILEQLGDKMRPESAKMMQDSAQETQGTPL